MSAVMIYITAASEEEARTIGRALVEGRLAACANILPGITSIFRWKGQVSEEREASLILKTTAEKVEALVAKVQEMHSYSCPCVVALPIAGGAAPFLEWIVSETA